MTTIESLRNEHVNLRRLLAMLDEKVSNLYKGTSIDVPLLAEVIGYVGGYADQYHHPREDQMYGFIKGRSEQLDQLMARSETEHIRLKQLSSGLTGDLENVVNDAAVYPMSQLISELELFVKAQIDHLEFEEEQLFPMIERTLKADDWTEIDAAISTPDDPLFGTKQSEEYRELYHALLDDLKQAQARA